MFLDMHPGSIHSAPLNNEGNITRYQVPFNESSDGNGETLIFVETCSMANQRQGRECR